MFYYTGLYFYHQIWWFKTVLLLWALFLFSGFIIKNSFFSLGSLFFWSFIIWNSFTTLGFISIIKFDHLKQFYYTGLYIYYQISWFKTALLLWALFQNIKFANFEDFYYTGHFWASLGSPGLPWAPLGSPGLFWALLGSSGLPWAPLGSPGLNLVAAEKSWQISENFLKFSFFFHI